MSLSEKRYSVKCWWGKECSWTAKEIYEIVQENSQSGYHWVASITELVRVCDEPDFPEEYAKAIKIAILDYFADVEARMNRGYTYSLETDSEAVYSCYHSLKGEDEEVVAVKQKYLTAIMQAIIDTSTGDLLTYDSPSTYQKICENWKNDKLDEYFFSQCFSKEPLNFGQLRKDLYLDFHKRLREALRSF